MKKLWIAGLAICLSLSALASCNSLKHEHITLGWRFTETSHWRDSKCTWNVCDFNLIVEDHIDENNDNTCDVCGYTAKEHIPTMRRYGILMSMRIGMNIFAVVLLQILQRNILTAIKTGFATFAGIQA